MQMVCNSCGRPRATPRNRLVTRRRETSLSLIRPMGDREAAARPVSYLDLILPGQPVFAGGEIAHVAVGAILRTAFDRDEAAMAELVDVVLDAPDPARFVGELRPHLRG